MQFEFFPKETPKDKKQCIFFYFTGKNEAEMQALKPANYDISYDFNKNYFITGDNIDALSGLQKTLQGKIKMIYIDPPYNVRSKLIYKDSLSRVDWLSMMYPRLMLARELLKDDGVIFISIDDNEQAHLKILCDEIFGERNLVAQFIWQRAYAPKNNNKHASVNHDFILCYAKNIKKLSNFLLPRTKEANARYKNPDNDPRGLWKSENFSTMGISNKNRYEITTPRGRVVSPPAGRSWVVSKEKFEELKEDNRIWFGANNNSVPRYKIFLDDVKKGIVPMTIWEYKDVGHTQEAAQETKKIFDGEAFFHFPKPVKLIKRICQLATEKEDIILDFFAGSGTTGQAVIEQNAEDGGNRKFILVQIAEELDEKSDAYKAGYKTIADIARERLRRTGCVFDELTI